MTLIHGIQEGMRENFVKKNKNKTKKQKDRKSVIILPFSFDQVSFQVPPDGPDSQSVLGSGIRDHLGSQNRPYMISLLTRIVRCVFDLWNCGNFTSGSDETDI